MFFAFIHLRTVDLLFPLVYMLNHRESKYAYALFLSSSILFHRSLGTKIEKQIRKPSVERRKKERQKQDILHVQFKNIGVQLVCVHFIPPAICNAL